MDKSGVEIVEQDTPEYSFENSKTGWKYSDEHVVGTGGKDRPTDEELDAIDTYINNGYWQMNDVTRGYDPGDDPFSREDIDTYVENLTNLIDRNPPLGTTALVYRGVYDSVGMKWSELEVGDELIDRGFVSTTNSVPTARGFGNIQLEIELGEDTKLIDVSRTVEGTRVPVKESEIILQRGTKFEVVAKTENGLRLRVVGSDTSGVIDVVSEEATKERLDPSLQKFSERTVAFTEDGRSQVKMLRIAVELGEDSAYIDWEPSGELYYIKVPAEYRRQGIATRLWEAAKEHARKFGLPIPTHSQYRTDEGDAWAKSLDEELPSRIQS
jgi:GNAT superfamily N-acetyltransferase